MSEIPAKKPKWSRLKYALLQIVFFIVILLVSAAFGLAALRYGKSYAEISELLFPRHSLVWWFLGQLAAIAAIWWFWIDILKWLVKRSTKTDRAPLPAFVEFRNRFCLYLLIAWAMAALAVANNSMGA